MKVREILEHFRQRADWVSADRQIDRVVAGDAEADVDRCLVTWMPSLTALRCLVERNIRLLICHEPTFWDHRDDGTTTEDPAGREKQAYIEEHGLVVLRNHDCWDRWPQIGMPWAWADHLGFVGEPAQVGGQGYQHRYDIEPVALETLAGRVAERCARLGEPMVQVVGSDSRPVGRIGIGTGCACDIPTFEQMGCDCSIVCDDGSCYWAGIQRAVDREHPIIRVNHGTSEEPGMVSMTRYINDHLEGLSAQYLPHGSSFRLVGGQTSR